MQMSVRRTVGILITLACARASSAPAAPAFRNGHYQEENLILELKSLGHGRLQFTIYPYSDLVEPEKKALCRFQAVAVRHGHTATFAPSTGNTWGVMLVDRQPFIDVEAAEGFSAAPPSICDEFVMERTFRFDDGSCTEAALASKRKRALDAWHAGKAAAARKALVAITVDCPPLPNTKDLHAWVYLDLAQLELDLGHPDQCRHLLEDLRTLMLPYGEIKQTFDARLIACSSAGTLGAPLGTKP